MTQWRRMIAVLGAMLLVLAGCGDDDGGGGGEAELGDLSGETVEVAAVWTDTEQERFEAVLEEFEEQTGATVNYTSTGDDIATVLGTGVAGGNPPDVAMLPQPGLMVDLAEQDALIPIEDVVGDLLDENFSADWRELATHDGELYGVFFKAANKSTVWYNTEVFENAGAEIPETWEDFIATANTISDAGTDPVSIGGGDGWTLTDWFENVYLRVAGGEMYDQLTDHEIPWTDPSVQQTLETLAELWGDDALLADAPTTTEFTDSVIKVFSDPPDAAIVYEGDFVAGVIEGETESTVGEGADFFPFPSVEGSGPAVVGGGDMAVLMQDSEGGRALIEFLATAEAAEIWAELGGFTSPNQNVDLDVYPDDITRRFAEQLVEAETFRFDMSDLTPPAFGGTPSQGMWQALQDFLTNPDDVQGTMEQLESAAESAY